MWATCFSSAPHAGGIARGCPEVRDDRFCLDALFEIAAWTLACRCSLIFLNFVAFLPVCGVVFFFIVCLWVCGQSEALFRKLPHWLTETPHCGIDVLCGCMCGVCRLCADILCPLRLLWLLYPVHWGSALPLLGGHPAVLCWHGTVLWLRARSIDPNRSPGGDILRPQRSGLWDPVRLVSDAWFFCTPLPQLFGFCCDDLASPLPASSTSSTWSMAWRPFSSSTASCCWRRDSTPPAPSSRPSANSGAPSAAAASAWRWEPGGKGRGLRGDGVSLMFSDPVLISLQLLGLSEDALDSRNFSREL